MANDGCAESASDIRDRVPRLHRLAADESTSTPLAGDRPRGDDLGAKGIQVFTNVAGKPLSAPEFGRSFRRMASTTCRSGCIRCAARSFPTTRPRRLSEDEIWFTFGWPYETTACMTRLIYSGLFDELPT